MHEEDDFKLIKKVYGEKFMQLCRELFPTLLEEEGRLYKVLASSFSENCKNLYEDIVSLKLEEEFRTFIYTKANGEEKKDMYFVDKTPYELFKEAGYTLTECLDEDDIQKFKKYYSPGEELCTFRDKRLEKCIVFWAVRDGAETLKREDYISPRREDEYGTSVMSIQFTKIGECMVSIKNRYNHTVRNPDATYGNDLNRIAPGLTESFKKTLREGYGLELDSSNAESFSLPGYVLASDGKYYEYNIEINGIYYCPGNIIVDYNGIKKIQNPESTMLIDYFILDIKNKTLTTYDKNLEDGFIKDFEEIEKIEIEKIKDDEISKEIRIYMKGKEEPAIIGIDKKNQINKYVNNNVIEVESNYLECNSTLTYIELGKARRIGSFFMERNKKIKNIIFPKVEEIGDDFFTKNIELEYIDFPSLVSIGDYFLEDNFCIKKVHLPKLRKVGNYFLKHNTSLAYIELPSTEEIGEGFMMNNSCLEGLSAPKLGTVGSFFLEKNRGIKQMNLPNLRFAGDRFLGDNLCLNSFYAPNLESVGHNFLYCNMELRELELQSLEKTGDFFLMYNEILQKFIAPRLESTGVSFLMGNNSLLELRFPCLIYAGDFFLEGNECLSYLDVPNLKSVGYCFLKSSKNMKYLNMPKFQASRNRILSRNKSTVSPKDLAILDKESKLTQEEIGFADSIIKRIRKLFKEKTDGDEKNA